MGKFAWAVIGATDQSKTGSGFGPFQVRYQYISTSLVKIGKQHTVKAI